MVKRLIKLNNKNTLDAIDNWIENAVPISESDYQELLLKYKTSGNFYRVLGFDMNQIEDAITTYFDIDMYDDNSYIKTNKQEFLNAFKTIIREDNTICSWTDDEDSIDHLLNDGSNSYDILILIQAKVEGIDINQLLDDYPNLNDSYRYQNEILGKQIGSANIIGIYYDSFNEIIIPPTGNLNEYINLFE